MKIEIRNFSGIAPRVSPELLPENAGQIAENMSVKSGKIHPEKFFSVQSPDRDYVPGQINDDQYRRLYFLDENGTICVCGTFPGGNGSLTSRKVGISAPGEPVLSVISSPFTDAFNDAANAVMMANSGTAYLESNDWKAVPGVATHLYSRYQLTPVDSVWKLKEDGISYERTYAYNPWKTEFYHPNVDKPSAGVSVTITGLEETRWSCPCALELNGSTFSFATVKNDRSAALKGKLYNYSGEEVGTYTAYNEKVTADIYPELETPQGATLSANDTICTYKNDWTADRSYEFESIKPGNLKFTISRNYTDIARDAYYVIRAVNDIGEEGDPSDISALITRQPDEKVTLTFSAADTAEAENIVKYRLYRATGGTNGADFLFVSEINASDGLTFEDDLRDEQLNEVMPRFGSVPEDVEGIAGMSGGFLAAYKGKDIYFSEPYRYNCFPWEYSQSVPFDIIGIAVRSKYLYVMTTGPLYAFVGDHPETLTPVSVRFDVPCISRKSIAHVAGRIIYAGTTGLVMIDNSGPRVFSDALYTIEQYKDLHFENCIAAGEYDGKYFAVFADKTLLFDFSGGNLVHTTLDRNAFEPSNYVWNDGSWDKYEQNFAVKNAPYGETWITQDFSSANLAARWKSRDFISARPVAFTAARVRFDDASANVTLKLYAENKLVHTAENIPCGKAFRLPVLRRECRWSVEVISSTDITSIEISESMQEL